MAKVFNAEWAIVARESKGMTQTDLSRLTGIPQAKVSRFENERAVPSEEEVEALALATEYDRDLFYRSDRVRGPGVAVFLHRKLARAKVGDTKRIHAECSITEAQVDRLLRSAEIDSEYEIPRIDLDDQHSGDTERAALFVRAKWNLPSGPIRNLTSVIEQAGGLIIEKDFGVKDVDALHRWRPDLPPIFFMNRSRPADRVRFSLSHELAHAILHQELEFGGDAEAQAEREANAFASAFLAPAEQIRPEFPRMLALRHLPALKKRWGMSMQALIRRARDVGVIDDARMTRLYIEINRRGWKKSEPVEIEKETPALWPSLLARHSSLGYTSDELASTMYVRPESVEEMIPPPVAGRISPSA